MTPWISSKLQASNVKRQTSIINTKSHHSASEERLEQHNIVIEETQQIGSADSDSVYDVSNSLTECLKEN